jgi:hypothetical protein
MSIIVLILVKNQKLEVEKVTSVVFYDLALVLKQPKAPQPTHEGTLVI